VRLARLWKKLQTLTVTADTLPVRDEQVKVSVDAGLPREVFREIADWFAWTYAAILKNRL
jgi:hypothetical protein